jgi:hypothetical protein
MAPNDDLDLAGQKAVAEVNQRIGVNRTRKPFTPGDFESYRPKAAPEPHDDTVPPSEQELATLFGALAGPYAAPKRILARQISLMLQRLTALEEQVNGTAR